MAKKTKSQVTYLNVDDLAPAKKTLTLNKVTHEMHQVNVGEFIALTKTADDAEEPEFDSLSMPEKIERLVTNIRTAFPSIPKPELEALALEQLIAIVKFTAGQLEEEAEAVAMAEADKGEDEKNA